MNPRVRNMYIIENWLSLFYHRISSIALSITRNQATQKWRDRAETRSTLLNYALRWTPHWSNKCKRGSSEMLRNTLVRPLSVCFTGQVQKYWTARYLKVGQIGYRKFSFKKTTNMHCAQIPEKPKNVYFLLMRATYPANLTCLLSIKN